MSHSLSAVDCVEVSEMEGLQSEAGRGLSAPGACEDPLDRVPPESAAKPLAVLNWGEFEPEKVCYTQNGVQVPILGAPWPPRC